MRVTFVQFIGGYKGGLSRCLFEFAAALSKHAEVSLVDPALVCQDVESAARNFDLEYHNIGGDEYLPALRSAGTFPGVAFRAIKTLPRFLELRRRCIQTVDRIKPDVICSFDCRSASLVGTSRKLWSIPLVIQLHGWYIPPMITAYGRWLMRNRAALVVGVSHQTRTAVRCAGIAPSKLLVLQNPVDVDAITRNAQRPLEGNLPGQDAQVRILLPGWICSGKGQIVAIEALAKVIQRGIDAVLWLAGKSVSGPAEEAYLQQAKRLAQERGVSQRVIWLGYRNDLPQLIRRSTVVVLPSVGEGHPLVVLEAMALGKPVAATPVGGVLDMILPEVTGMLFEVGDADGLARCIEKLSMNPALAERISSLGLLHVKTNYNPKRHAELFLEILSRATKAWPQGRT